MANHARNPKLPGSTLLQVAEKIFQGDAAGCSLEALIADAQQEWVKSKSDSIRGWIRIRTTFEFWRALFEHLLRRWLTPPNWRVVWLMTHAITAYIVTVTAFELYFKHTDPSLFVRDGLINGLVVLPCIAAFLLHPVNIARRIPSAPDRGWWYFVQFLCVWFGFLGLWLYGIGGSGWQLVAAAANAFFGWFLASRPTGEPRRSAREK